MQPINSYTTRLGNLWAMLVTAERMVRTSGRSELRYRQAVRDALLDAYATMTEVDSSKLREQLHHSVSTSLFPSNSHPVNLWVALVHATQEVSHASNAATRALRQAHRDGLAEAYKLVTGLNEEIIAEMLVDVLQD